MRAFKASEDLRPMSRAAATHPVDLLLFVEHAARELDVAAAVTARLRVEHGMTVHVAPTFHRLADTLARFEPRAVAVPYFAWANREKAANP